MLLGYHANIFVIFKPCSASLALYYLQLLNYTINENVKNYSSEIYDQDTHLANIQQNVCTF